MNATEQNRNRQGEEARLQVHEKLWNRPSSPSPGRSRRTHAESYGFLNRSITSGQRLPFRFRNLWPKALTVSDDVRRRIEICLPRIVGLFA
jgi:hypothetical protein